MTLPVQTGGYKSAPIKAYPGQLLDGPHDIRSVCCDEVDGIPPGVLLVRTGGGDHAAGLPSVPEVDADGIMTTKAASASGAQSLTPSDWNGALGTSRFTTPRRLTITLNSHANWDATSGSWTFPDENGVPVTEAIPIPDGGNVTLKSTRYASGPPTAASIPQQSGVAATYTIGVAAETTLDGGHVLGVGAREHKARITPVFDENEIWDEGVELGAVKRGKIAVQMESAFRAGDHPYVRLVAGVGEQRGRFRGDADGGDAVVFTRARLLNSGGPNDYAHLDLLGV